MTKSRFVKLSCGNDVGGKKKICESEAIRDTLCGFCFFVMMDSGDQVDAQNEAFHQTICTQVPLLPSYKEQDFTLGLWVLFFVIKKKLCIKEKSKTFLLM